MYGFLLTRRWIAFHLFCLALMPLMVWLGFWQWHRYESAHHSNEVMSRNLSASPARYGSVVRPGDRIGDDLEWRRVSATGRYDTAHELLVRRRLSNDGDVGYDVLTPLATAGGRTVLVDRGWVAQPEGDPRARPKVPAVPRGKVTVFGRLRPDESGGRSGVGKQLGLPDGQVMQINGRELARDGLGGHTPLPGYLELTSTSPKPSATPQVAGAPDQENTGLHVAYTLNWWVFTVGVPVAWWKLVARERDERARRTTEEDAGAAGPGGGPEDADRPDDGTAGPDAGGGGGGGGDRTAAERAQPDAVATAPSEGPASGKTASAQR